MKELRKIDGIVVNSNHEHQTPYIINFAAAPIKGETLVHALEEYDVYISAKSACSSKSATASRILLALGITEDVAQESVRVSFSHLSTKDEVDQLIKALKIVVAQLKH